MMSDWVKKLGGHEATKLLTSIRHWQSVVKGETPPGKPMVYYQNRLKRYTEEKIKELEARVELHKINRQQGKFTMPAKTPTGLKAKKRLVMELGGVVWRDQRAVFDLGHVICNEEYTEITSPIAKKIVEELQEIGFGTVYVGSPDGTENNTMMYFNLPSE